MLLFLTDYAQYGAHEKTCALFCTKLWVDYYIYCKSFYEDCFKIFPIMLVLRLIFSETYYALNYAGIIGLGLRTMLSVFISYNCNGIFVVDCIPLGASDFC